MSSERKTTGSKQFGVLTKRESLTWCFAVLFLLAFGGWAWILKGPTAKQAAGDPGVFSDYLQGLRRPLVVEKERINF